MTESVGAIEYTVEAETAGLLTAEKAVDKSTREMVKDFDRVDKSTKKLETQLTKTAKNVKTGMAGMGRGAGQAGIQLQQFIGQVQGGQNAMLALSQQSADLGFVLGAPLVGAVVGISASIAGLLLPNLFKSVEGIRELKDSTDQLSKAFDELTEKQKQVARAALEQRIKDQTKEANGLRAEINKLQSALISAQRAPARGEALLRSLFGETPEEANKKLIEAKASLAALSVEIKENEKSLSDLGNTTKDRDEQVKSATINLESQIIALRDGEEAALRFAVAQQLGLKVGEQIPEAINRQIDALFRLKEAQDAARAAEKSAKADQQFEAGASSISRGVAGRGMSQLEKLEEERALIQEFQELEIGDAQAHADALKQIDKEIFEERNKLIAQSNEELMTAFRAIENQAANSLTGFITGAKTGKEAIHELAQAVLTQLVGALVRMGIQAAIGQTTAAATGAATAASLATAYATPAALASLASFGANAAPAAAGITSTVGLSNSLALAGAREDGGPVSANGLFRMGEGNKPEVLNTASGMFVVPGDQGRVFNQGQLDQINGGGGFKQEVTVINNTPANVKTETSADGKQMRVIINEIASQISSNQGVIARSLRQSTNTQFKGNS